MDDNLNVGNIDFDVVMPNKNETEFIDQALSLGYKKIVFLVRDLNYVPISDSQIKVLTAYLLKDVSEIGRARKRFNFIFAVAERKFFESDVDFIIDSELSDRRDSFHYKATSLNHVHADLAKKNNIAIVFGFSNLIYNTLLVKGKMNQNAMLVRKYKLKHATFSLAARPTEIRSREVLDSLGKVLGL
jgi:hypothetical protein